MPNTKLVAEPGTQEILITREFDAPQELIFKLMTDPELIPQWWGDDTSTTVVDKMDARPGGQWRYVITAPDGEVFAFNGVYHSLSAPHNMVYTFEWEGAPGHVLLETITLEALPGGRTKLTDQSVFQSVADRDGMLAYGMEEGADATYERLNNLIKKALAV